MNNSLRKRNLDALSVKGDFQALAQLAGYIPLFERLCLSENFDDKSRIAKIINTQKLRRVQDSNLQRIAPTSFQDWRISRSANPPCA